MLWAQSNFIMSRSLLDPHYSFIPGEFYWQHSCHLLRASYVLGTAVGTLHELFHVLELMGLWPRHKSLIFLVPDLWLKDVKSHASTYILVKGRPTTGPYPTAPRRLLPACSLLSWKIRGTFMQNWRKLVFDKSHTKGKAVMGYQNIKST